jgi:ATP-dependent Clp protease ATP-binding subunit ClpB
MTSAPVTKRFLDLTKRNPASEKLYNHFSTHIIGQDAAVTCFTNIIEKYQAGLCDPTKPAGNAIFLGPTGSGKTYAVECAAEALFGNPRAMIKIDCAEFQHSHEIAKLVGSPPGYLGHRETHSMFTQEALNQYHNAQYKLGIILFDEIEKASDSLWTLLLGVLDKATLTTGTNVPVNFSQQIIVMTSNLGVADVNALFGERMGFIPAINNVKEGKTESVILEAMKRKFTPEFLNRIDNTVVFKTLTETDCKIILAKEMGKALVTVVQASGCKFRVTPDAQQAIFDEGYSKIYNARHIKRAVEKRITLPLAQILSSNQAKEGEKITVGFNGDFEYYVEG